MSIGRNIKKIRKQRGLSQEELGDMSGLSASQISYIENGKKSTSVERLAKIAEVLQCKVADFYDDDQKMHLDTDAWLMFGEKMNKEGITPEQVEKWIRIYKEIRNSK